MFWLISVVVIALFFGLRSARNARSRFVARRKETAAEAVAKLETDMTEFGKLIGSVHPAWNSKIRTTLQRADNELTFARQAVERKQWQLAEYVASSASQFIKVNWEAIFEPVECEHSMGGACWTEEEWLKATQKGER